MIGVDFWLLYMKKKYFDTILPQCAITLFHFSFPTRGAITGTVN